MKLFRRKEPKSTHPHAGAMEHLSNAHKALHGHDTAKAKHHIGHALKQVQLATPPEAPEVSPGSEAPAKQPQSAKTLAKPKGQPMGDNSDDGTLTGLTVGVQRLKSLNQK